MQDARKHLEDPISGLIFFDPVSTRSLKSNSGKTFEREGIEEWIRRRKHQGLAVTDPLTNEEISEELTSNDLVRSMARAFVEAHPNLYAEDKVYLPQSIKDSLVTSIRTAKIQEIKDALQKDPRLITTGLNKEGSTALQVASQQQSLEVFQLILDKLPAGESEKRKQAILKERSLDLTRDIGQYLGIEGLDVWCQYLKFDAVFFYHSLAQHAILTHDSTLLSIIIPRINVNMQETKTGFTFLHTAVKICVERINNQRVTKISDENLVIIKLLFENGADGKLTSNEGLTPAKLADQLGRSDLAVAVETERRRVKFAPLIEPLQARIRDLESQCAVLELAKAQVLLELKKHEQAIVQAQTDQRKQLAVSEGLLQLEQQKHIQAFVPKAIKSITCSSKIKMMLPVGSNYLVCGLANEGYDHSAVTQLVIFDLSKPSDKSIVSSIKLTERSDSCRLSMQTVDEDRFVYCFEKTDQRSNNKESVKIILWNIANKSQEKAYALVYDHVNIVQVINSEMVLISGKREYQDECALLNLKSGEVKPHKHLELVDFNEWNSVKPTYFKSNVELAYIYYEKNRSNRMGSPKEIRLYNALKNTNLCLTQEEVESFEHSSSKLIFKFISSKLIAISRRSQYNRQENPAIKIFDIDKKHFIHTFIMPPFKQQGWNTPVSEGFYDVCLTPDGLFMTVYHDPEQTKGEGSRLIIWEMGTGQVKFTIPIEGHVKQLTFDETRKVLYASTGNSVQIYQIYPESVLNKAIAEKTLPNTTVRSKTLNL